VLRAVRAAAPQVDVYMLSNFASEPYRRLAAELGARDFFDKSSEIERVRDLVASRASITA
jgi:DNA-binding NarL/FixJ family response regulator